MNFDIERIKKVPKLKPYKGTTAEDWCEYLGDAEYIKKPVLEDKEPKIKIKAISDYYDVDEDRNIRANDIYEVTETRAKEIIKADYAKYVD